MYQDPHVFLSIVLVAHTPISFATLFLRSPKRLRKRPHCLGHCSSRCTIYSTSASRVLDFARGVCVRERESEGERTRSSVFTEPRCALSSATRDCAHLGKSSLREQRCYTTNRVQIARGRPQHGMRQVATMRCLHLSALLR